MCLTVSCPATRTYGPHPGGPARRGPEIYSTLLVSASDKLHNARSIVRDLRVIGDQVWGRFSVSKQETLWY